PPITTTRPPWQPDAESTSPPLRLSIRARDRSQFVDIAIPRGVECARTSAAGAGGGEGRGSMAQMQPPPMQPMAGRPMGATVVAIIDGILGVLAVLLGVLAMAGGALLGGIAGSSGVDGGAAAGGLLAGVGFIFGIIVILIGVLYLAIAYG